MLFAPGLPSDFETSERGPSPPQPHGRTDHNESPSSTSSDISFATLVPESKTSFASGRRAVQCSGFAQLIGNATFFRRVSPKREKEKRGRGEKGNRAETSGQRGFQGSGCALLVGDAPFLSALCS